MPINPSRFPRLIHICLFLCAAVLSGFTSVCRAQVSHTSNVHGIEITLALDKTSITVGEPIVLSIVMENPGLQAIVDLSASFQFPEGNGVSLMIQPPGELAYHYSGALDIGTYPATPLHLFPGQPLTMQMPVLFDETQANGFAFSRPGNYQVSGNFSFTLGKAPEIYNAQFPDTVIHVTEPTGTEAEVLKMVDQPLLVRSLHLGVAPTTGILNTLEEVAGKYPATQLGAMALRAAGLRYVHAEADAAARDKGARMLQQYLANGAVAHDGDYIALTIAGAYHMAGQYDIAREWVYYLIRNFPESIRIRPEDVLLKYYYYDPAMFASKVPWYLLKEPWKVPKATAPSDLKPKPVS